MAKRVIIGGLLGGIALFIWGFLAHMVLGLGSVGFKDIPNEAAVRAVIATSVNAPGLYIFPGLGLPPNATMAQQQAAMKEADAKAQTGPNGLLVIHPYAGGSLAPQLINEFVLNVVQALLLASLLAWALPIVGYVPRVASSPSPDFSARSPRTFNIGIGTAFPRITPSPTSPMRPWGFWSWAWWSPLWSSPDKRRNRRWPNVARARIRPPRAQR